MPDIDCHSAIELRPDRLLCQHFGEWVSLSRCNQCVAYQTGEPLAVRLEAIDQSPRPPCNHLGLVVADEPCNCGSATRVSIHACHCPDRIRSWQDHAWCVPLQQNWNRLADPMARTSFQCCEGCQNLTVNV